MGKGSSGFKVADATPPAISTRPSANRVAVCSRRGWFNWATDAKEPVPGSNSDTVPVAVKDLHAEQVLEAAMVDAPPTMSTLPSSRRVAV